MTKHWVAVASKEHVLRGRDGSFMQVCHGKAEPLNRINPGDWVVYYSPVEIFGEKKPYQRFTALGYVAEGKPYQVAMTPDFIPWRRDVTFAPTEETPIRPLISQLDFIKNKERWGFPFRRGIFAISENDFQTIAKHMGAWPI